MCRPYWDREDDGDELESEEDEPNSEKGLCGQFDQLKDGCSKDGRIDGFPADEHPDHEWICTKRGYQWYEYWLCEQSKRNQNLFDMHIYTDWTGYGTCEIV